MHGPLKTAFQKPGDSCWGTRTSLSRWVKITFSPYWYIRGVRRKNGSGVFSKEQSDIGERLAALARTAECLLRRWLAFRSSTSFLGKAALAKAAVHVVRWVKLVEKAGLLSGRVTARVDSKRKKGSIKVA